MRDFPAPQLPPPSIEGIVSAAKTIDRVFTGTPLAEFDTLTDALGCRRAVAKVETLNPIRSFKGRGASWFLAGLDEGARTPLVAASAGNFGQGLAYAARSRGRSLTVFAATTASPTKITAMRRLGAQVRLAGQDFDAAKEAARAYARDHGAILVVDGDHPAIAEGAGTIACELTEQCQGAPLDTLLVPLGNGALATGIGTWIKEAWPGTRVVAVASAGAPAMARSWYEGQIVETGRVDTIADGIAVRVPVPYALSTMRGTVDEVVQVADTAIITAMRLIHREMGLVVEPAGAAGLAAVLADPARFRGQQIGTVLCGANLTPEQISGWLLAPQAVG